MMLLRDTHARMSVLQYLSLQLGEGDPCGLLAAGLHDEQLARLKELSSLHLRRLAAMRQLRIEVSIDAEALKSGLRSLGLMGDAKSMETYFLRNGASWRMMRTLFKMGRKETYRRRRSWQVLVKVGNVALPGETERRRIFRAWTAHAQAELRTRYYQLHQAFPQYTLSALERVIRLLETVP